MPGLAVRHGALRQEMADKRLEARQYTRSHGEDLPEVTEWAWGHNGAAAAGYADSGGDNA